MGNGSRAVVGIVAVVAAVVLFVVLQDSGTDDESEPALTSATTTETAQTENGKVGNSLDQQQPDKPEKPEIPTIEIEGGEPVGGVAELEFDKGDQIEFFVESDVADHVHLHGYDVFQDVTPGKRIKFSVPATADGIYEVELEDRVVPIAEITVNP